jgi:N-acyl amino acid synthase of PEP-CTERM/exosortase system
VSFDDNYRALYGKYFTVVAADTPTVLQAVYRLRYQVYCEERRFENRAAFPNGMEIDRYDADSVHAALVHLASGTVCGCVRLVLPCSGVLPIHNIVVDEQARARLHELPLGTTAEVSRYAVSTLFRRRVGEHELADATFRNIASGECRRLLPHITIGLLVAVTRLSIAHGTSHLTAVMAPALLKLLRSLGMDFTPIGPMVQHHGTRQPCFASVADLLNGLRLRNPVYYDYVTSHTRRSDAHRTAFIRAGFPDPDVQTQLRL